MSIHLQAVETKQWFKLTVFGREDNDGGRVWAVAHFVERLNFDLVLQEVVLAPNKSNVVVVETWQLYLEQG